MVVQQKGVLKKKIKIAEKRIAAMPHGAEKDAAKKKLEKLRKRQQELPELRSKVDILSEITPEISKSFTREELSRLLDLVEKRRKKKLE